MRICFGSVQPMIIISNQVEKKNNCARIDSPSPVSYYLFNMEDVKSMLFQELGLPADIQKYAVSYCIKIQKNYQYLENNKLIHFGMYEEKYSIKRGK